MINMAKQLYFKPFCKYRKSLAIYWNHPFNTYPEIDINNLPWFERFILYIENIINKIKNILK